MPFSSVTFLFAFLPIFLCFYFGAPQRFRSAVALLGSGCFYAWGAPKFLLVLLSISALDYAFSRRLTPDATTARRRKALLVLAVSLNLSLLFYFKYANFLVHEGNRLRVLLGKAALPWEEIALPMGVSFIVFEEISYLVDVYRGAATPARRFSDYALFLLLFPHSIAGPIFRWKDLERQLRERVHSIDAAFDGFLRFSLGLAKKALIANHVASVADQVFGSNVAQLPTAYAWVGLLAYSLQIYFDFSGYSDMAIGLGKMMGFSFKENFDSPYASASVTEFWRRWHISLSTWLRDYLYIPLGGSRAGSLRLYRNLLIVFLACGFWHGANWTFLAWGAYHGAWLVTERATAWGRALERLPRVLATPLTFLFVMLGWVLFRADDLDHAIGFFGRLFKWYSLRAAATPLSWGELVSNRAAAFGLLGIAICFAGGSASVRDWFDWMLGKRRQQTQSARGDLWRFGWAMCALALSSVSLVNAKFNPFIYFRF
jgi:alginate O-acetyltransferase complex protein AlgI